jgi:cytochrome c oxidase subunit IV
MAEILKVSFITLTLFKAGYIVMVFMHLGDEKKNMKLTVLVPYFLLIGYLIFICLVEGTYVGVMASGLQNYFGL